MLSNITLSWRKAAVAMMTALIAVLMLSAVPVFASGYDDDDDHHEYNHKHGDKHENRAMRKMFKRLDDNDDDAVSLNEYLEMTNEIIARMDDDENGEISVDEWPRSKRHRWVLSVFGLERAALPMATGDVIANAEAQFNEADGDGSGTLTRDEYQQGRTMQMFKRLDTNGDGAISAAEFLNHRHR